MQTCSSCGERLRPLFTSLFCPNECDASGPRSIAIDSERWWVALVSPGGKIPTWATKGWYVIDRWKISTLDSALLKMKEEWGSEKHWWKIENSSFKKGVNDDVDGDSILVFGKAPLRNP